MSQPPPNQPPPAGYPYYPPPGQPPYAQPGYAPQYAAPPPAQYAGGGGAYAPPQGYGFPQAGAPQQYYPPAGYYPPPTQYAAPPGQPYAPPGQAYYAPPTGAPPPGQYAPPTGPPLGSTPAPATAAVAAGYPGAAHGAPVPPAGPPPGPAPPMPATPYAMPGMPGIGTEPPTVVYRDITIHNPKFSGGLSVWGYDKDQIVKDINAIINAGSDEKKLINILVPLGPLKLEVINREFHTYNKDSWPLLKWVERKTTGNTEKTLMGLVQGPLRYDAQIVNTAIQGIGTKESLLNEAILDHSPQDIALLDAMYRQMYGQPLWQSINQDLSGNVAKLFKMVTDPSRKIYPEPADPPEKNQALLDEDIKALYKGGAGRIGTSEETFYRILTGRRHDHLVQICHGYKAQHKRSLLDAIKSEFGDSHDSKALQYLVKGAYQPEYPRHSPIAVRDAIYLEKTMEGLGTNDELLMMRCLRAHWSRGRMEAIKAAYLAVEKKTLPRRIKGETSGSFKEVLQALVGPDV